jgi:hypothetical protein
MVYVVQNSQNFSGLFPSSCIPKNTTLRRLDLFPSSDKGGGEDTQLGPLERANLNHRVSLFVWLLSLDLSGMGAPTSSYATADIALRVSGAPKPHHHDKVETPSVLITIMGRNKITEFMSVW